MPKKVLREYKLTQIAILYFEQGDVFPPFKVLNKYLATHQIDGRSSSIPTDLKQGLPVTLQVAEAFVRYLNINKIDAPSAIHQIIESSGDDSLGGIFEKVKAFKSLPQNESNDPCLSGLNQLGPAADHAIMSLEGSDPHRPVGLEFRQRRVDCRESRNNGKLELARRKTNLRVLARLVTRRWPGNAVFWIFRLPFIHYQSTRQPAKPSIHGVLRQESGNQTVASNMAERLADGRRW